MDILNKILMFALFIGFAWYVIQPLLQKTIKSPVETENTASLEYKKRALYRQIKELEMDYEIGNLEQSDYLKVRNGLKREVAEILSILNHK